MLFNTRGSSCIVVCLLSCQLGSHKKMNWQEGNENYRAENSSINMLGRNNADQNVQTQNRTLNLDHIFIKLVSLTVTGKYRAPKKTRTRPTRLPRSWQTEMENLAHIEDSPRQSMGKKCRHQVHCPICDTCQNRCIENWFCSETEFKKE